MENQINVSKFINEQKLSRFQILVIVLCGIIAAVDGFDTQAISFAAPVIAESWGVAMADFGIVFAIGLFGLMLGSMIFGIAADRLGRKNIILVSLLIIGVFSLLTAFAESMNELLIYRLITGIGLGGVIPNILAMTSEYSPKRIQNTLITVMFCGFPLGAVLGGLAMSKLIPIYGWEIVFYVGGIIPLLMIPVLMKMLPESIRFLVSKEMEKMKTLKILNKINSSCQIDENIRLYLPENQSKGFPVKHLFTNGLAKNTLLIWVIYFMNLLILYSLINWLPSILKATGFPIEKAIISTVVFNLGGIVGGVTLGRLIDMKSQHKILAAAFALGAVVIGSIGFLEHSISLILCFVFFSGFFVTGSLLGVQALTASLYSTDVRSTGIGWALGIGRMGSIIGPLVAGVMLTLKFELTTIFLACAVPAVIAALAMSFLKKREHREEEFKELWGKGEEIVTNS